MNSYEALAHVYDRLMDDVDRESWAAYLVMLMQECGKPSGRVLDAACGTGEMTLRLLNAGYDVIGSDRSEEMLEIARERMRRQGRRCILIRQDLTQIELPRKADVINCACDGVNYLTQPDEVLSFFQSAYHALKEDGMLMFDISSESKLRAMDGAFYAEDRGDVAYIWNNKMQNDVLEMDLTFFLQREDGLYTRMDEFHRQRAHNAKEVVQMLHVAGFCDVRVYRFCTKEIPEQEDQRIQFVALKKEIPGGNH